MSAQPAPRRDFVPYTPEQRAAFLAGRFGSTTDWASRILVAINYPVEDLRWFVDAVVGVCKGKERRIAHATLATRARRYKNPSQAKSLVTRARETDQEWARLTRRMIFDIEKPRPGEREGKEKRARTLYTDYLTPAAVFAQEMQEKIKHADPERWKKDSKYRFQKRDEILAAAVEMLPSFERVEDMPPSAGPKEQSPLSLSEYVEQRETILLAENRRIVERVCEGEMVDADEIDARLAALEVYHRRAVAELERSFQSAREVLIGLRRTRCVRAMDFTDPDEVVRPVDEILAAKGVAHDPLSSNNLNGKDSREGVAHDPLSEPLPEGYEEVVIGETAAAAPALSQLDCALSYAALGKPVFPTKPDKAPHTPRGFKDATTDEAVIRSWWARWPAAGVGIPTGKASGWLVLDVDPRHGGDASLSAFCDEHGHLPATAHAKTPSGGDHFVFDYPAHVEIGNSAGKLGKGLDVRGEGGYLVAPGCDPARRWTNALDPAAAPGALLAALLSDKHEPINTDRKVVHHPFGGAARHFAEGERNEGLRDVAAGRWVHGYAETVGDLYQQLREVRDTRCAPGKDSPATDAQLMDLARRTARKYARGEPRGRGDSV